MNQKLTLSLNAEVVDFAHSYSKKSGRSVSKIVENYFRELKTSADHPGIPREVAELRGILKEENIPGKKELRRVFHEDHIS
ncbi:MAG: DUF6364 family protein [Spirochaetaceae bacterium]|nr:DUF6364 family protein [Spirochaetaceae bacterium]